MSGLEEKIRFAGADGLNLCGILGASGKRPGICVILCHGLTVDKEEGGVFTRLAGALSQAGLDSFRFDFRGNGESDGDFVDATVTGEVRDLEAAVRFLESRGYSVFGFLGASFGGGAVALHAATNPGRAKALVMWNALIDYADLIEPRLQWHKAHWGRKAWDTAREKGYVEVSAAKTVRIGVSMLEEILVLHPGVELGKAGVPVLFVHGDQDEAVSCADSVKYSTLVPGAELVIIHGAAHGFHQEDGTAEAARKAAVDFFLRNLLTAPRGEGAAG